MFVFFQLPYGERRMSENLPPDAQRTLKNLATARFTPITLMNASDALQ